MTDKIGLTPREAADDHVVPVADAGGNDPTNLVAACADCNVGKAARGLTP